MFEDEEILADRLNQQPTIFRGCTSQELTTIAWVSAVVWIPICVFITGIFGNYAVGFSIGGIAIGLTMFVLATIFQKIKRGRPDGYYQQLIDCFLEDNGFRKSKFIRKTGLWSTGRTEYNDKRLKGYQNYLKQQQKHH